MKTSLPEYGTIKKRIGETPLEALKRFRKHHSLSADIPLAYAGRLDPMAEGTLLILIGDTCKRQEDYHALDKEYEFEVLFGAASDTGDVLGIVERASPANIQESEIRKVCRDLIGPIELPYPHFSAKTVLGKPLHMWTLEGRLGEIAIPKRQSRIYDLQLTKFTRMTTDELVSSIEKKVNSISEVTDPRKVLGRNFRRDEIREAWKHFESSSENASHTLATFTCTSSSGTYMRSLSEFIAQTLGTKGLAFSIRRTKIGTYWSPFRGYGMWIKTF